MEQEIDIYPIPSFPTLLVRDLGRSREFYIDVLGFIHVFTIPGEGGIPQLEHLRFCRYADILLRQGGAEEESNPGTGIVLTFSAALAGRSCQEIAETLRQNGRHVKNPVERPWNVRELTVVDPDGYVLQFVEPLDRNKTMDDVLGDITGGSER